MEQGYTLSFLVRPWAISHGNLFNLKNKKSGNGLNVKYGWDDETVYFDNGWNSLVCQIIMETLMQQEYN